MNGSTRRLPWLPSAAGSIAIHGALAVLAISLLPQSPGPEDTRISIAPLNAATANPLVPDQALRATHPPQGEAPGPQAEVEQAVALQSSQSAASAGPPPSAEGLVQDRAPAAIIAAAPALREVVASEAAAPVDLQVASGMPAAIADQPTLEPASPVDTAQLQPEADTARIAPPPTRQQTATAPSEDHASAEPVQIAAMLPETDDTLLVSSLRQVQAALPAAPGSTAGAPAATPVPADRIESFETVQPASDAREAMLLLAAPSPQDAVPTPAAEMAGQTAPPGQADRTADAAPAQSLDPSAQAALVAEITFEALADEVTAEALLPTRELPFTAQNAAGRVAPENLSATELDSPVADPVAQLASAAAIADAVADAALPWALAAAIEDPVSAATIPPSPAVSENAAQDRSAGPVAAVSASPLQPEAVAPAPASTQLAYAARSVTVQFARVAGEMVAVPVAPSGMLSEAQADATAIAEVVGGDAFGSAADRSGAGQTVAAPAPITGEPASAPTVQDLADIVLDADQECFAALLAPSVDRVIQVASYGQDAAVTAFASDLRGELGEAVPLATTVVSSEQCGALQAVQNWPGYPAVGPALELSDKSVESGGTVTASIASAPGEWVYVLLIDEEGMAVPLAAYVAEAEGTTRSAPPAEVTGTSSTAQLVAAVVSPTSLASLAGEERRAAAEIFAAVVAELERRRIRASLSVTAFAVE